MRRVAIALPLSSLLALMFLLSSGCSKQPVYKLESVEIESVSRSFPDRDDWLHVVEGTVSVRFAGVPGPDLLEETGGKVGIALYVHTTGNPNPMYFFQYQSGEPDSSRIAHPYVFEESGEPDVYVAKWELTDIYFGDEEFNDSLYNAIAVAGDVTALERLIEYMSLESLLNLPNKVDARLVFSEPFEVERGPFMPLSEDSIPAVD